MFQGEKDHVCTTCDKAFSNARVLKTHMNTHILNCEICLKTFVHYSELVTHKKTQHVNDIVPNDTDIKCN